MGTVDKKTTKENTLLTHVCNVHTIFLMILALELRTSLGLYIRSLCSWLDIAMSHNGRETVNKTAAISLDSLHRFVFK